jgi:hypothetical protein
MSDQSPIVENNNQSNINNQKSARSYNNNNRSADTSCLFYVIVIIAVCYYMCDKKSTFKTKRSHNTNMKWYSNTPGTASGYRSNMMGSAYDYNGSPVNISVNDPVNYMRAASEITIPSSKTIERQLIEESVEISNDVSKDDNTDSDVNFVDQHMSKKKLENNTNRPASMTTQRSLITGS